MPSFDRVRSAAEGGTGLPLGKIIGALFLGILALNVFFGSYEIVPPGHRGIVIHAGSVQNAVLEEGLTFKIPFYTTVKSFPVRVEQSTIKTQAASKDMQTVHATLSLNWHITPDKVNDVFRRLGEPTVIEANVITNAVSEVLKAETAKMSAEEILGKRVELKNSIDKGLVERLKAFDVSVDAVNLSDFTFEAEFNKAVEEKQIAEQNAKKAEYTAQQAEVDARASVNKARGQAQSSLTIAKAAAESTLVQARADAESNALKQKTLTDQLIRYSAIEKWNGALPSVMSGKNGAVPFLNLDMTKSNGSEAAE